MTTDAAKAEAARVAAEAAAAAAGSSGSSSSPSAGVLADAISKKAATKLAEECLGPCGITGDGAEGLVDVGYVEGRRLET